MPPHHDAILWPVLLIWLGSAVSLCAALKAIDDLLAAAARRRREAP